MPPETLAQQQAHFAAWLRDPQHAPPPPMPPARQAVYRELFFNNVRELLGSTFPVLRRLLGEDGWSALVRRFYRQHRCRTPLFPELSGEFYHWLCEQPAEPAFLHELAHYEWIELALSLDPADTDALSCNPQGDLLEGVPLASPLAWPLAYRFPVQRISKDFQPETPDAEPTFILIRRDAAHQIHFHALDALAHALMLAVLDNPQHLNGRALIDTLLGPHPEAETLRSPAIQRLHDLRTREAIVGTTLAA